MNTRTFDAKRLPVWRIIVRNATHDVTCVCYFAATSKLFVSRFTVSMLKAGEYIAEVERYDA